MSLLGGKRLRSVLLRAGKAGQSLMTDTFKRFAFEARDLIQDDVAKALDYSNASTRGFISRFRVRYTAGQAKFSASIYPAGKKSESLLARHVERYRQTAADHADLLVDGKMAIPLPSAVKRDGRGRVRRAETPRALLQRDARGRTKGFVTKSGRVLFKRGKKGGAPTPAFVLESSTTNPQRVDVHASFHRAIITRGAIAFGKALRKAVFG